MTPCCLCPSAGHNLESTWLVADTLDYLDSIAAISPEVSQEYRATAMSIGAAAVRDGYDMQHGGVYESGSPTTGPQSKIKVWWVQAEAMLALWKLHQYYDQPEQGGAGSTSQGDGLGGSSGSAPSYLEVLAHTVSFVREHQTDAAGGGEQFWQVRCLHGPPMCRTPASVGVEHGTTIRSD